MGKAVGALLVLTAVAVSGLVAWNVYQDRLRPVLPDSDGRQVISVPEGASTDAIARMLAERGLIRDPLAFRLYARSRGLDGRLRAGEFELSPRMDVPTVVEQLVSGPTVTYPFTIPEGYTVVQIADLLAGKGLVDRERFLRLARDPRFRPSDLPSGAQVKEPLEGYLFPDTYRIPRGATEEQILTIMRDRLDRVLTPQIRAAAAQRNLTVHQLLTLASVIEKEATVGDRALVSAVFHNRLRRSMKLDSCATINYVLERPKLILTYEDLDIPSPYNTYRHPGLPPGPIANPGEAAIRAALAPADVPYLYFVAKSATEHAFATTFDEHRANQARFQTALQPGSQP